MTGGTGKFLRRWGPIIVAAAILAGGIGYFSAQSGPPRYRATAVVQIGGYMALTDPTPAMIEAAATFAQTYIALLRTETTLDPIIQTLNLPLSAEELGQTFEASFAEGTSLLNLTVTYSNAETAAAITEALTNRTLDISPAEVLTFQREQTTYLQEELRKAQTRLGRISAELEVVEASMNRLDISTEDRTVLFNRRAELLAELTSAQESLTTLTTALEQYQDRGEVNTVQIIQRAKVPTAPISVSALPYTILPAAGATFLATLIGLVFEFANSGLRSLDEVMPLLNAPVLGLIPPFGVRRAYADKLIVWGQPNAPAAEAYRALRMNIAYRESAAGEPIRVLVLSSPGAGDGKSVTAANLAAAFATSGTRVALIDASLKHPAGHKIFGVPNTSGLSNIWSGSDLFKTRIPYGGDRALLTPDLAEGLLRQRIRLFLSAIVRRTDVPNLDLIPAGPAHPAPAELLAAPQMFELVRQLIEEQGYDLIVFDAPSLRNTLDPLILARTFRARLLMVVEPGRTRRGAMARSARKLAEAGIPIFGAVVNHCTTGDAPVPVPRRDERLARGYLGAAQNAPRLGAGRREE